MRALLLSVSVMWVCMCVKRAVRDEIRDVFCVWGWRNFMFCFFFHFSPVFRLNSLEINFSPFWLGCSSIFHLGRDATFSAGMCAGCHSQPLIISVGTLPIHQLTPIVCLITSRLASVDKARDISRISATISAQNVASRTANFP